ncbi:hypothetical protein H671_2g4384 [Cricetulus griseus]|nr:hypothetical protein H671_2g4384 [Cricetulus griseus]
MSFGRKRSYTCSPMRRLEQVSSLPTQTGHLPSLNYLMKSSVIPLGSVKIEGANGKPLEDRLSPFTTHELNGSERRQISFWCPPLYEMNAGAHAYLFNQSVPLLILSAHCRPFCYLSSPG